MLSKLIHPRAVGLTHLYWITILHKKGKQNIWNLTLHRWIPKCLGFSHFSGFLHHLLLAKLAGLNEVKCNTWGCSKLFKIFLKFRSHFKPINIWNERNNFYFIRLTLIPNQIKGIYITFQQITFPLRLSIATVIDTWINAYFILFYFILSLESKPSFYSETSH